jgi:S-adenosylmethionine:tRNA ribosyltransferase-isomerase
MQKVIRQGRRIGGSAALPVEWGTSRTALQTMTNDPDDIASYDYELPAELIASVPVEPRDAARLLVVDRSTGRLAHRVVRELPELLSPGDHLVFNDTKVVPARLRGVRQATGGRWEGLFLRTLDSGDWELLSQTRGRLAEGEAILITPKGEKGTPLRLFLRAKGSDGTWIASAESDEAAFELLERHGEVPLPPYIRKGVAGPLDAGRYQTIFARSRGSVAAPTAGLHFTENLLGRLRQRGTATSYVTLHVGVGTFRPIATDRLSEHRMHAEWGELSSEAAAALRATRAAGGRIVSVGTTSVRALESAAAEGELRPFRGETRLFIRPPYRFRAVDALLTNFHLPRSTLLALVSAFAGRELVREAYAEAIRKRYRFYSYGDAMLIL